MDVPNKKKKRPSVSFDQSHGIEDGAKAKFKYQTLLKEYLEVQKEYVSKKRKLQAAKQKREIISAEVRFLRRKRKYLLKSHTSNKPDSDIESNAVEGVGNQSISEAATENLDEVQVSNTCKKIEEAEKSERLHEEDVKVAKKLKNRLVHDKGVGKRKNSWPDQVSLKV